MTAVPVLPMPVEDVELCGHLFIHHSYYIPGSPDRGALIEFHDEEHSDQFPVTHPHTHKAPPEPEEWSWE